MKLNKIKQHIMTGISYMIPVIVAGGILYAFAKSFGGWDIGDQAEATDFYTQFWFNVNLLASTAMSFAIAVFTAGIAYSISGKSGIASGLVVGYLAVQIKAGFLGGMIMGLFTGVLVNKLKEIKLPDWGKGLVPVLIIPVLSTLVSGLVLLFVVGKPIAALQDALGSWISGFQSSSNFALGSVIGACMGFDMGGPINKTASAVANGLLTEGIYGPVVAKIVGGMIPPIGIGLAVLFNKKKFSKQSREMAKTAIPMGLVFVTEGVLPFAANDPLRVIASCMAGSALGGGLAMALGVESYATHGGILIAPLMNKPIAFLIAVVAGSLLTAIIYSVISKPEQAENVEEEIEELDLDIEI